MYSRIFSSVASSNWFQHTSKKVLHTSLCRSNAALNQVLSDVDTELRAIKEAGTMKHEHVITTKQGLINIFSL